MYTNYERIKAWRHRTKETLMGAFGGSCGICNYSKSKRALCLHHLDPNEKEFNFDGTCRSWAKVVEEAKKCVMLCHNCHSEVHDGITEIPKYIKRFDEKYTDINELKFFDICPVCGKRKRIRNITCSISCAAKHRYNLEWENIDLLSMYNELKTYTAVANVLGVSDHTVRKRIIKLRSSSSSG